jgi:DNA-binding MarR family transcriptional regulator
MTYEQLKLENQICFPIYAASRLITREYQPLLDELGLTYPQYLVLMVLWESDGLPVNEIGQKLLLNTNTVTPLLKRMEAQGVVARRRSAEDERRVIVSLTSQGRALQEQAVAIPAKLVAGLNADGVDEQALHDMLAQLQKIIHHLSEKQSGLME